MLGFHFYRCREDTTAQPPRPAKPAPQGLYIAAAKLVQVRWQRMQDWLCCGCSVAVNLSCSSVAGTAALRRCCACSQKQAATDCTCHHVLQAGRTSLEALLSHMAPSDEDIKTGVCAAWRGDVLASVAAGCPSYSEGMHACCCS